MTIYSPERKSAPIIKTLPPHNQPVSQLSRQEGIPIKTLYHWRSEAGISTPEVSAENAHPREWSREACFAVLVETVPLSAHTVTEYCRRKGLYLGQIQQWKDELMQPDQREEKALINREIVRKDKSLAEAAALLMLQKKLKALFDEENGDE